MNKDQTQPLPVSVLGMDNRSLETLKMYLSGPCKSSAIVVDIAEAEVSLIDMDGVDSKEILAKHQKQYPDRPIIQLSLVPRNGADALYIKKPVTVQKMLASFNEARNVLNINLEKSDTTKLPEGNIEKSDFSEAPKPDLAKSQDDRKIVTIQKQANPKRGTHKTAMLLDDKGFKNYIGSQPDIDPGDPEQVKAIHYRPQEFLQDYVQRAFKLAASKQRILRLDTGWKPITIFPHTREVWIDTEDAQLRAACWVPISRMSNVDVGANSKGPQITIKAVNGENISEVDTEKFQLMDSFLWKVALWTSRGKVPEGIDLDKPVYLRQWPNMTRLVIVPHALRIAALLMEQPRSLLQVAEELQIRQQYVFAFFSAAYALGLANQVKVKSAKVKDKSSVAAPKPTGLLRKVLGRLRIG